MRLQGLVYIYRGNPLNSAEGLPEPTIGGTDMSRSDVVVFEWREAESLHRSTVSTRAFALHALCADFSRTAEQPGFVDDTLLSGVPSDVTMDVLELCLEGLWQRVGRGYFLLDVVDEYV